jgi:hypothetical protein
MKEKEYDAVRQSYCIKYDTAKKEFNSAVRAHGKKPSEKSSAKVARTEIVLYEAWNAFNFACAHYNTEYGFAGGAFKGEGYETY